jgi:SAM-dependent methyltransferase
VSGADWLADTRRSYDTVADSYAGFVDEALARKPLMRGALALFAERVRGGGPVLDVGCGPGQLTAYLRDLGLDTFGVDLSPRMIEIARRAYPDLAFEVGSMTDLAVADTAVGGLLAWYCLMHVPDAEVPTVLGQFHRVLRPGGVALLGFHVGDQHRIKTDGYGGHPMTVHLYRRPVDRVAGWLRAAGFTIEAQILLDPDADVPAGILLARRPSIGDHD